MPTEDITDLEVKKSFAVKIIESIESQEYEGKLNSVSVLGDIFDSKNYIEIFKSEQINRKLFSMLHSEGDKAVVKCALIFLNTLYRKFPFYTPKQSGEDGQDSFAKNYLPGFVQSTSDMEILPHINTLLKEELPVICTLIEREEDRLLTQQYGQKIKCYGAIRIQATYFIISIISQGKQDYALLLAPCLSPLLENCVEYQWNSMLHNNVETIFKELFKIDSKYEDGIRTAVIAETDLTNYIASLEINIKMPESGREIRSGIVATFFSIANMLKNHPSEYVQKELYKNDKWIEFVETELKLANDNNEQALAGHQSKGNDSDDDISNYETNMDKLFEQFSNLKKSHDSSRDLEEEEDEEPQSTENILDEIQTSDASSDSDSFTSDKDEKEESKKKSKKITKKSDKSGAAKEAEKEVELTETLENTQQNQPEPQNAEPDSAITEDEDEENLEEDNSYYDNSYWRVDIGYKLDDLLQDC